MPTFFIGSLRVSDPVFLAPMTGVSDWAFRRTVKKFGAGLVFSEMIASRPMLEEFRRTPHTAPNYAEEFPMVVQLAGCEPDIVAEAARMNVDKGAAVIDLNFGCPVKKVVNKMAGSALMRDETLSAQIMEAAVKAVSVPVTVKMRLGWDEHSINAPRLAKIAQDVGVQMITVHGRTRNQMYNGNANWQAVRAVKDAVRLPVVVNGDITTPQAAKSALEQSGADGVMIGRGACGKPWLLKQIMDYLSTGTYSAAPSSADILQTLFDHYDAMLSFYGEYQGISIARKHISWYCEDFAGYEDIRPAINQTRDVHVIKETLTRFFETLPES